MSIIQQVEDLITPLLESEKMELVDVQTIAESGKKVVRVFLDKEGGVNLADCELMSRKLGDELDKTNIFPEGYALEVSSPGMDRILKKEKDFLKFKGKMTRIVVFAPINGQRNFLGEIISSENNSVTIKDISGPEGAAGKIVTIEFDKMARARLEPEI